MAVLGLPCGALASQLSGFSCYVAQAPGLLRLSICPAGAQ